MFVANPYFSGLEVSIKGVFYQSATRTPSARINSIHPFNFNQIGEEDVVNVIDKLPSKTSSGVDGISTNLLKDIKYIISKPLTLIINQCLETGDFHPN